MKTFSQTTKGAEQDRRWHLVDAQGLTLGRLATEVATLLRGKHKPTFTPHIDSGDFVVVVNAEKISLTGKKIDQKSYFHHSGYIGGIKEVPIQRMLQRHPERVVAAAVKGMIPRGALGHQIIKKLKVYAGTEHPHQAQAPEQYTLQHVQSKTA